VNAPPSPAGLFEVELKFPLAAKETLLSELRTLAAVEGVRVRQSDQYFQHPARDLRTTGEAFRLRRSGDENCLTYKGPRVDSSTKTRREIEVPMSHGDDAARLALELLTALGFTPAGVVTKSRSPWTFVWQGREFCACIDNVDGLGEYLELETLANPDDLSAARQDLLALAEKLQLRNPEHRSYLNLLQAATSRAEGTDGETN
jgi:adenylate cyclase class 2